MVAFFSAVAAALAVAAPVMQNLGEIAEGGRRMFDFAADIWERFCHQVPAPKQQAALREALAQAAALPQAEFDRQAVAIVEHALPNQPPEERAAAVEYLKLIPERIRTTFIRPEDPSGTTVPADFVVRRPQDLIVFLPPRPSHFKPGDAVPEARQWILVERLGIGGFGEVWKARNNQSRIDDFAAFKFCLDPASQGDVLRNELENVLLVKAELFDHVNIVKLQDAYLDCATPWLRYDYIPGGDLSHQFAAWSTDVVERTAKAVETVGVLASTLAHCHAMQPAFVVHRDMKPANVLRHLKTGTLKITDFGISNTQARHTLDEARSRMAHATVGSMTTGFLAAGTPLYASDQQMRGERPHPADDVHALGVMLFQLILGDVNRPLNRDYISVLERQHMCRQLIDLLTRSIASDRPARFQHAGELAEALKALPGKLIAKPVVISDGERKQQERERQFAALDRLAKDAAEKNAEARRLFDQRQWNEAKALMDRIAHPVLHDRELYKVVSLYAEGKRLKNKLGIEFAWVPPGTSWLGGGGGNPGDRQFDVEEGFWAGIYPVTQQEWQAVVGDNPSNFKGPRLPVERVSWDTITNSFLPKLNQKCQGDGYLYRLPIADEWEYLSRGGPISKDQSGFNYYFARSKKDLTPNPTNELTQKMANFGYGGNGKTSEVGSFLPNPLGLYDLVGNVWEWTATGEGSSRFYCGGGWYHSAGYCVAAYRDSSSSSVASYYFGFRLLAVPLG